MSSIRSRSSPRGSDRSRDNSGRSTPSRRHSLSSDRSYSDNSYASYSDEDHSKSATKSEHRNKSYKTPTSVARSSKAKKGKGKRQTTQHATTHSIEEVTKRMLSARRHKILELKNENEAYKQQLEVLRKDNKMLAREQRIQERALGKYEGQENDMANILQRHSEEVRVLKDQLRKQKDRYQKSDRKRKDAQEELDRTKRLVKKMQSLVNDKELKERDELSRKLTKAESDLDEKEKRVNDLERHVEHLKKNHRHEIGIEMARHRETQQSLQEFQNRSEKLEMQIKEKEKELEIKNIYSNRIAKPPHHLNTSVNSTPTPSIRRDRSRKRSEPGLTPREKAKLYEIKRREEDKNKNEKQSSDESKGEKLQDIIERKEDRHRKSKRQVNDVYNPKRDRDVYKPSSAVESSTVYQSENSSSVQTAEKQILTDDAESSRSKAETKMGKNPKAETKMGKNRDKPWDFTPGENKIGEKPRVIRHSDRRFQEPGLANTDKERERNADSDHLLERMKLEEQPKQNGTEKNVEVNNLYEKWERERKEKEERERRRGEVEQEKDEEDNRWREDRERRKKESALAEERQERERREREDKERRELETKKRLEREEEERKQREEWEREKMEREKKERREREEEARRAREEAERFAQQEIEQKKRHEKDALLAKMRALDENKQWDNNDTLLSKSKKKDYSFTEPVENMHHGRPAYGNVTVPVLERNPKKSLSDDDGTEMGYLPSFASKSDSNQSHKIKNTSKVGVNNTKKADLMATLFGSPEHNRSAGSSDNDRVFGIATQSKNKNSANKAARESSSTALYGGGSAIIDDNEAPPSSNSHLLPRRTRQQPTVFHNRPTINAVDDIDDDLEEVVL